MNYPIAQILPEKILWFFHGLLLCLILPYAADLAVARFPLRDFLLPAACGFLILFFAAGLFAGSKNPPPDADAALERRLLSHQLFFFAALTCFQIHRFSTGTASDFYSMAVSGAVLFWFSGVLLCRFRAASGTDGMPVNFLVSGGAAGAILACTADPARPGIILSALPLIAVGVMFLRMKGRKRGTVFFAVCLLTLIAIPAVLSLFPGQWRPVSVERCGAPYRMRAENGMLLISANGIDTDSRAIEGLASQKNVPVLLSVLLQPPRDEPLNVAVYSIGESPLVRQLAQLPLIGQIHVFSPGVCAPLHENLRFGRMKNPVARHDRVAPDEFPGLLEKLKTDLVILDFPWPDRIARGFFFTSGFFQSISRALPENSVVAVRIPGVPSDSPELARASENEIVKAFPFPDPLRLDGPYDSFLTGMTPGTENVRPTDDFEALEKRLFKRTGKNFGTPGILSVLMPYWRRSAPETAVPAVAAPDAGRLFLTRVAENGGSGPEFSLRSLYRHPFSPRLPWIFWCAAAVFYLLLRYLLPSWNPSAKLRFYALEQGMIAGCVPVVLYFNALYHSGGKDALVHLTFTAGLLLACFFSAAAIRKKSGVWPWLLFVLAWIFFLLSGGADGNGAALLRYLGLASFAFLLCDFAIRPGAEDKTGAAGSISRSRCFLTGAGAAAVLTASLPVLLIPFDSLLLPLALLLVLQFPKKNAA